MEHEQCRKFSMLYNWSREFCQIAGIFAHSKFIRKASQHFVGSHKFELLQMNAVSLHSKIMLKCSELLMILWNELNAGFVFRSYVNCLWKWKMMSGIAVFFLSSQSFFTLANAFWIEKTWNCCSEDKSQQKGQTTGKRANVASTLSITKLLLCRIKVFPTVHQHCFNEFKACNVTFYY